MLHLSELLRHVSPHHIHGDVCPSRCRVYSFSWLFSFSVCRFLCNLVFSTLCFSQFEYLLVLVSSLALSTSPILVALTHSASHLPMLTKSMPKPCLPCAPEMWMNFVSLALHTDLGHFVYESSDLGPISLCTNLVCACHVVVALVGVVFGPHRCDHADPRWRLER